MYNSEAKVLGTAAVAGPTLFGLGMPVSLILIILASLFVILGAFYAVFRFRNRAR